MVEAFPVPAIPRAAHPAHGSAYRSRWGRLLLAAAFVDGMTTAGVVTVPLLGYHAMAYRILLPACMFLLLLRVLRHTVTVGDIPRAGVYVSRYLWFIVAWLLFAALSLVRVVDLDAGIRQVYFLLEATMFILLATLWFDTDRRLMRLVRIWLVTLAITGCIGLWEIATYQHLPGSRVLLMDPRYFEMLGNMPSSTFGHPNSFAFYLTLTLPLAFAWWRRRGRGISGLAVIVAAGIGVGCLTFTQSRLAYIAFAFECVVLLVAPILARRERIRVKIRRRHVALLLMIAVVAFAGGTIDKIIEQLLSLREGVTTELADDPRLQLQAQTLDVLRRTYGLGVGPGNIEVYLAEYPFSQNADVTNPHGLWVEIAGNYGVPFFIAFTVFYLGLLRATWRVYRWRVRRKLDPSIAEGAFAALCAYPAVSFGPASIMGLPFHWIFLAFCLAVVNVHRRGRRARLEATPA